MMTQIYVKMVEVMAPSHYLKQCLLITRERLYHSPKDNFIRNAQDIYPWYEWEYYQFMITTTFIRSQWVNILRPRQNGWHFPNNIFKRIFLNENVWISIKISLKFVPKGPINNIPALVQIMAWRRPGDKPLFEPMMVSLLMHIWRHLASMS